MSFKFIAIRPLNGCDQKLLKVLNPSTIYKFYQDYEFLNESGKSVEEANEEKVNKIKFLDAVPSDFYSSSNLAINVCAIVGKNGSGKSTLIEFLFAAAYRIAINAEILTSPSITLPMGDLFVELFYASENEIVCIRVSATATRNDFDITVYTNSGQNEFLIDNTYTNDRSQLFNLFYTISVNYSIYGLNSLQMGSWVEALFHKNDGYQTPVVINPFRHEGKIDINREQYLAKQRLLSNLILNLHQQTFGTTYEVTDTQRITSIRFRLDLDKIQYAFARSEDDIVHFDTFFKTDPKEQVLNAFYDLYCDGQRPAENIKFKDEVELYIIRKLIKIARTYRTYQRYFVERLTNHIGKPGDTKTESISYSSYFPFLEGYLTELRGDKSHLTFKLRQARNYLLNGSLQDGNDGFTWETKTDLDDNVYEELEVELKNLSNRILQLKPASESLIEFIPPSIFNVDFNLVSSDSQRSTLGYLSSGEQQQIHTIQTVLYHLLNLDSVHDSEIDETKFVYTNVNVVLDEIELYFHPEFQRNFLKRLIDGLLQTRLSHVKNVNILFSTHSPFILSDIPVNNILGLDGGKTTDFFDNQTFGANIHDLLRNEFFLSKGFMGEFAKTKINEVINFLTKLKIDQQLRRLEGKSDKLAGLQREALKEEQSQLGTKEFSINDVSLVISMVGEPVLKNSLSQLFNEVFPQRNN